MLDDANDFHIFDEELSDKEIFFIGLADLDMRSDSNPPNARIKLTLV